MRKSFAVAAAVVAAAAGTSAGVAHASRVLVAPENFQGSGLGPVNTILTMQSPGSTTTESAAVGLNPGSAENGINITCLDLRICSPAGTLLFDAGPFTPVNLAGTQTGTGNSGFVFALDATRAAQARSAAFGVSPGTREQSAASWADVTPCRAGGRPHW